MMSCELVLNTSLSRVCTACWIYCCTPADSRLVCQTWLLVKSWSRCFPTALWLSSTASGILLARHIFPGVHAIFSLMRDHEELDFCVHFFQLVLPIFADVGSSVLNLSLSLLIFTAAAGKFGFKSGNLPLGIFFIAALIRSFLNALYCLCTSFTVFIRGTRSSMKFINEAFPIGFGKIDENSFFRFHFLLSVQRLIWCACDQSWRRQFPWCRHC